MLCGLLPSLHVHSAGDDGDPGAQETVCHTNPEAVWVWHIPPWNQPRQISSPARVRRFPSCTFCWSLRFITTRVSLCSPTGSLSHSCDNLPWSFYRWLKMSFAEQHQKLFDINVYPTWNMKYMTVVSPKGFQESHTSCRRRTGSSINLKCMRASDSDKKTSTAKFALLVLSINVKLNVWWGSGI